MNSYFENYEILLTEVNQEVNKSESARLLEDIYKKADDNDKELKHVLEKQMNEDFDFYSTAGAEWVVNNSATAKDKTRLFFFVSLLQDVIETYNSDHFKVEDLIGSKHTNYKALRDFSGCEDDFEIFKWSLSYAVLFFGRFGFGQKNCHAYALCSLYYSYGLDYFSCVSYITDYMLSTTKEGTIRINQTLSQNANSKVKLGAINKLVTQYFYNYLESKYTLFYRKHIHDYNSIILSSIVKIGARPNEEEYNKYVNSLIVKHNQNKRKRDLSDEYIAESYFNMVAKDRFPLSLKRIRTYYVTTEEIERYFLQNNSASNDCDSLDRVNESTNKCLYDYVDIDSIHEESLDTDDIDCYDIYGDKVLYRNNLALRLSHNSVFNHMLTDHMSYLVFVIYHDSLSEIIRELNSPNTLWENTVNKAYQQGYISFDTMQQFNSFEGVDALNELYNENGSTISRKKRSEATIRKRVDKHKKLFNSYIDGMANEEQTKRS